MTTTERETRKAALLKMSHADLLTIYNRYFVKKAGKRERVVLRSKKGDREMTETTTIWVAYADSTGDDDYTREIGIFADEDAARAFTKAYYKKTGIRCLVSGVQPLAGGRAFTFWQETF